MIKILLADDNKLSLQYFSELICWEDYGYELVATAIDGENAWYDFQKYMPQVVIADIQMPILSGIDLARKVLSAAPETVFLFLSSYSEFQYARAALKLKVYDYLLKHETTKEVFIQKLMEIRMHIQHTKKTQRLLAKEDVLSLFLHNKNSTCSSAEMPLSLSLRYDCFFLEQQHPFPFLRQSLSDCSFEEYKLSADSLAEHCYQNFDHSVVMVPISEFQFLLLTSPNHNPFDFCCQLQRNLMSTFSCSFSIVIVQKNQTIQECAASYENMRSLLTQIYFYPPSAIIEGIYLTPQHPLSVPQNFKEQYSTICRNTLSLMDHQYQEIVRAKDYSCFCQIAQEWIKILLTYDRHTILPSSGQILSLFPDESCHLSCDINEVYQWIRQKFVQLIDTLSLCITTPLSHVIQDAIFLISTNYGDYNLNVEWIAERLQISPSNLNTLFKKETGCTPWKIIVNTRLSHARQLLMQSHDTPTQICYKTGYNSLSYFSKSFKKAYGLSPQEYRRKYTSDTSQT